MTKRDATILSLVPLVRRLARRVKRVVRQAEHEELLGEGYLAIVRAVDRYDTALGIPLEGYAAKIVFGSMINALRRRDPVGERARRVLRAVERERFALAAREGAMPSERRLEEQFPQYRTSAAEVAERNPLSLDSPLPEYVHVPIDWSGDPLLEVLRNERDRAIEEGIAQLPQRKRAVVVDHYVHGQTLATVGSSLGITRQRVSQLHISALRDLRTHPYLHAPH
uniref:Putative Sigma-70 region 4 domain protein n=1 Tax=mine drainage metagenome TaxID=410659 RepID=E6Q666_9ZZZZ